MKQERNIWSSCPDSTTTHYESGERKVRYIGASDFQVNWGASDDPRGTLVRGEAYEVEREDQYSWHTKLILHGIPVKRGFPSGAFEDLDD